MYKYQCLYIPSLFSGCGYYLSITLHTLISNKNKLKILFKVTQKTSFSSL